MNKEPVSEAAEAESVQDAADRVAVGSAIAALAAFRGTRSRPVARDIVALQRMIGNRGVARLAANPRADPVTADTPGSLSPFR